MSTPNVEVVDFFIVPFVPLVIFNLNFSVFLEHNDTSDKLYHDAKVVDQSHHIN